MENMFTEVNAQGEITPILVYATDDALTETPVHLSGARQVWQIHLIFCRELQTDTI